MKFRSRVLLAPLAEGGGIGGGSEIRGKNGGQDARPKITSEPITNVNICKWVMEGQERAVESLAAEPYALAYIAAFHGKPHIRKLAMDYLHDAKALLMVANSSPHYDTICLALEKLGKVMDELEDDALLQFAAITPIKEDRQNALQRLKALAEKVILLYSTDLGQYAFHSYLMRLNGEFPGLNLKPIKSPDEVERYIGLSVPISANRAKVMSEEIFEKSTFDAQDFMLILERS